MKRAFVMLASAAFLTACSEAVGLDELSDFMIRSPGDYYFANILTFRPSAASSDSIVFQWSPAAGADSYTLVFKQVQSADSADSWQADLSDPTFTIPVTAARTVMVPYGVPNPALDTVPLPEFPVLQYSVKLSDLDALIADQPQGVALYYVWTIEAHRGSQTGRSVDVHRFSLIRS